MTPFLLIFVAALIVAGTTTPLARHLAHRFELVDKPSARKAHLKPMPLLGGVAMYFATIIALLLFGQQQEIAQLAGILIGATLVSFCGLWDDRRALSPAIKLVVQFIAALILISTGVVVTFLPNPILNLCVTLVWVVGITNAFNLLDNMDGLSGGVCAIASLFFLVLAITSQQFLVGSLAAALLGACVGFLLYNFNPARIFMGDSGSLFLGFVLAAVGIKLRFLEQPTTISWMIPIVVLAVPIFDTTLVTVSRLRRGLNPLTTPSRDHLSHRLVRRGLSHREAVMSIYLICGACGVAGILLTHANVLEAYAIGIAIFLFAFISLIVLELDFTPPFVTNESPLTENSQVRD